MKFRVFAIYDDKAKAYLPPFIMPETGQAVRLFTDAVNNPQTQYFKHPADYTMFQIGEFDDNTGVLKPGGTHELVCGALQLKEYQTDILGEPELPLKHKIVGVN
nr:MAG: nonstructural protein [Microvirus sp.]